MVLFDNIIFSIQTSGGVSVVWTEIFRRIAEFKMIKSKFLEYTNDNIFRKSIEIDKEFIIKNKLYYFSRYIDVKFNYNRKFIFHSTYYRICSNRNAINITTVHDFTYEYYSKGLKKFIHCWQKYRAIKKSDVIICISENTKKDLIKFLPNIDESKISVIYNGVSEDYFVKNKQELSMYSKYILFIGSRISYKNFNLAVNAISQTSYKLKIVGGGNLKKSEIEFLNKKLGVKNYEYLGSLNNNKLNDFYNNAFCLLYPSAYEGFGIPIIEAQKAGCPVIAFNGSSVPEVIGSNKTLLNRFDTSDIFEIIKLLENPKFRNEVINNGLENSKRFSWDKTIDQMVNLYQKHLLDYSEQ